MNKQLFNYEFNAENNSIVWQSPKNDVHTSYSVEILPFDNIIVIELDGYYSYKKQQLLLEFVDGGKDSYFQDVVQHCNVEMARSISEYAESIIDLGAEKAIENFANKQRKEQFHKMMEYMGYDGVYKYRFTGTNGYIEYNNKAQTLIKTTYGCDGHEQEIVEDIDNFIKQQFNNLVKRVEEKADNYLRKNAAQLHLQEQLGFIPKIG